MDWVKLVDFKKAESLNTTFVSDEFKNRESDIIYRLKLRDKEIYLYLLIEFQSYVDRFMALRMLRYTLELYDYLIKNKKLKELPVVFPLMLYNGKAGWTAPESVSELINLPKELKSIKKYVPEFRYFSIIENRYSDRELNKLGNIVSSIFLIGKIKTPKEAKSMLAETIKELKKDWFKEGMQKGVVKGRQEGVLDGKKATAKAMKKEKIDLNTIAKVTGLSIAAIKKL